VRVTLNGHDRDVPDGCSVDELIRHAGLDPLYVIVERNAEPVERKRYPEVAVEDGDRIELVRAVAGG
jgi:sulfur carrier protein